MSRQPITKARPWTPTRGQFAGRTFTTEREYRDALAKVKGHRNWYEQQRAPKKATRRVVGTMRPSEKQARARALDALALMRNRDLSLSAAAREAHTTPNTIMRWTGTELAEKRGGRRIVTKADRLYRTMRVVSTGGTVEVEVRGSRQARRIAQHMNAVKQFLATGDETALRRFEGAKVAGVLLETDPDKIEEMGRVHELSFEDIYSSTR
jgi:hypothetical protein